MKNNIQYLIIHHSGGTDRNPKFDSSNLSFYDLEAEHAARFQFKSSLGFWTGYHYFIDKYGKLYQARADNEEGAHTKGVNLSSLGICLAGNFDVSLPNAEQVKALTALLKQKSEQYTVPLSNIVPHRKFAIKTCYGKNLYNEWAADLIRIPTPNPDPVTKAQALTAIQKARELIERIMLQLKINSIKVGSLGGKYK